MKSFQLTVSSFDRSFVLPVLFATALLTGFAFSASAQSAIDDLVTETDKVDGVYDAITPAAVGSMVFGVGAIMVKRIAFA